MSNGMLGMNPEEVRGLAQQMDSAVSEIEGLSQQLTASLQGTTWQGNDRQKFESDWNGNCVSQLRNICDIITQAAQDARRNADEQVQASA